VSEEKEVAVETFLPLKDEPVSDVPAGGAAPEDRFGVEDFEAAARERLPRVAYDYYAGQVIQSVPLPRPEQFQNALEQLSKEKSQPGGFTISSMLDSSYVDDAVRRGLDKK
jgi:hypothetical protein